MSGQPTVYWTCLCTAQEKDHWGGGGCEERRGLPLCLGSRLCTGRVSVQHKRRITGEEEGVKRGEVCRCVWAADCVLDVSLYNTREGSLGRRGCEERRGLPLCLGSRLCTGRVSVQHKRRITGEEEGVKRGEVCRCVWAADCVLDVSLYSTREGSLGRRGIKDT